MGWIGTARELRYVLEHFTGADRDADGKILVSGGVAAFMGDESENADVVVDDSAVYFVSGQPRSIAQAMAMTSYGLQVKVF